MRQSDVNVRPHDSVTATQNILGLGRRFKRHQLLSEQVCGSRAQRGHLLAKKKKHVWIVLIHLHRLKETFKRSSEFGRFQPFDRHYTEPYAALTEFLFRFAYTCFFIATVTISIFVSGL